MLDIQTNVASLLAQQNLSTNTMGLNSTFNQLSSGYRINSAADDAAGLAIGNSMNMQVTGYTVAERNANDAVSMAQTADGALGQVSNILNRMQQLATESSNGDMTSSDRSYLNTEFGQLQSEVTRIMSSTKFNGNSLLAASTSVQFQIGISNTSADHISVTFGGLTLTTLVSSSTSPRVSPARRRRLERSRRHLARSRPLAPVSALRSTASRTLPHRSRRRARTSRLRRRRSWTSTLLRRPRRCRSNRYLRRQARRSSHKRISRRSSHLSFLVNTG